MILFGGSNGGATFFNSIYIFDVVAAKWTQGTPGTNFRTRMACTYSQNQFIAWGGSSADDRSTMLDSVPVVYDVQYDKWSNTYSSTPPTAPPPPIPSTGGNGTGTDNSGGGSKSSGAVIGGAAAAAVVALIAGVAGFIFYRKKKRRAQKAFSDDARVAASLAADGDNSYRHPKDGFSDGDYSPSSAQPNEAKSFYQNKKSSPSNDYLIASRQRRQQQQQYQQQLQQQQQQEQQQRPFDQFAAASGQQHQWAINTATTPKADAITMAGLLSESRPYTGYTEAYSEDGEQLSLVPPSSTWSNVSGSRPHSGTGLLSNDERGSAAQNNSNAFVIHHPLQKQGSSNPLPPTIPETPPFQSTLTAAAAGLASAISANGNNNAGTASSAGHSGAIYTHPNTTAPIPIPGPTGTNSTSMSLGTGPSQGISPPVSPTGTTYLPNQQAHQQLPRQLYASSAGNRSISSEIAYQQPVQFQQLGNYQPTPYRPGPSKPGSANTSAAISVPGVTTGNPYQQNAQPSRPYVNADTTSSSSSDDLQRLNQSSVSAYQQQQKQQQQQQQQHQQQQQQQQSGARPRSPSALLKDTDEMYGASPNMSALRDSKSPQVYYPDILAYYAATAPSTPALANKTYDGLDAKQQELLQQLYQDHQQQLQQLLRKQQLQQQEQELQLQIHQQQQLLLQQQQQNRNYLPSEMSVQGYNAQKDAQMAPSRSEGYRSPSPSRGPHLYVAGTPTDYVAPPRRR